MRSVVALASLKLLSSLLMHAFLLLQKRLDCWRPFLLLPLHRLNMDLDLQVYLGSCVQLSVLIG